MHDEATACSLLSAWVSRTGSASDWSALQEALYKCIDTIQYNKTLSYTIMYRTMHEIMHVSKGAMATFQKWKDLYNYN